MTAVTLTPGGWRFQTDAGRAKQDEQIEAALDLLAMGCTPLKVARETGLKVETVKELQK